MERCRYSPSGRDEHERLQDAKIPLQSLLYKWEVQYLSRSLFQLNYDCYIRHFQWKTTTRTRTWLPFNSLTGEWCGNCQLGSNCKQAHMSLLQWFFNIQKYLVHLGDRWAWKRSLNIRTVLQDTYIFLCTVHVKREWPQPGARGACLWAVARLQCGESGCGLLCAWLNMGNEAWLRREERSVSAGCAWPSCSYATRVDG